MVRSRAIRTRAIVELRDNRILVIEGVSKKFYKVFPKHKDGMARVDMRVWIMEPNPLVDKYLRVKKRD